MIHIFLILLIGAAGVMLGLAVRGAVSRKTAAISVSIILAAVLGIGMLLLFEDYEYSDPIPDTTPAEPVVTEGDAEPADDTEAAVTEEGGTEKISGVTMEDTVASATSDMWDTASSNTEAIKPQTAESHPTEPQTTVAQAIAAPTTEAVTSAHTETALPVTEPLLIPAESESERAEPATSDISADESAAYEPEETEPPETTAPDYRALAAEAYSQIVRDAAAYIAGSPKGNSFESFPFEREDTYSALSDVQKEYYDEILNAVENFEVFEYCSVHHDLDDVRAAFDALMTARPDLQCYFKFDEHYYQKELLSLHAEYFLPSDGTDVTEGDKSGIISDMAYFEAACDFIVASMPKNITVYDKYRYLASVMTLTTDYDMDFEFPHNNATAYGGIVGGRTICYGYSIGYEYLCAKADLYCGRVRGITHGDSVHMWNLGKLTDGTYHIDVTWSDNGVNKPCTTGWMKYFMVTQEKLLEDHVISDGTVATGK